MLNQIHNIPFHNTDDVGQAMREELKDIKINK